MEQENAHSVLQRLLRSAGEAAVSSAVTPTRALRLAMARAAEQSVGLNLSVLGVTEEMMPLDEVLAALTPEMMLLTLGKGGVPLGLAALDLQLRTATVEMQTVGTLRRDAAPERRITDADAALCAPLISGFLADLAVTAEDTSLEGWANDVEAGVRIEDARAAGMILEDCVMRLVRLSLDLATGERQGELLVALTTGPKAHPAKSGGKPPNFGEALRRSVMEAPAEIHAILHRFQLSLRDVEQFEVGQVIPLSGVTVGSVVLEGPDQGCVGHARLGQVTGLRAVRVERTAHMEMSETNLAQHLDKAMAAVEDLAGDMAMDITGADPALPGPMDEPLSDAMMGTMGDLGADPMAAMTPEPGAGFEAPEGAGLDAPADDAFANPADGLAPAAAEGLGDGAETDEAADFGFDAAPMMAEDPEATD